jgi:hypothetical protein
MRRSSIRFLNHEEIRGLVLDFWSFSSTVGCPAVSQRLLPLSPPPVIPVLHWYAILLPPFTMASYNNLDGTVFEDKIAHKETATALPRPQSYDDEDAGDNYHDSLKGETKHDKVDMSRMGKIQELRVCCS